MTNTMTRGNYYIGDLCYVMKDAWDEVCGLIIAGNECLDGIFALKSGIKFATFGTAYGDGSYSDECGRNYSVDAGLIGCILISDIADEDAIKNTVPLHGQQIEFETDFEVGSENGVIYFGNTRIDTDPNYEDEEEDYWGDTEEEDEE